MATGAFYATDTGSTHRSTVIGSDSGCGYVMVRTTNGSWVVETLVEPDCRVESGEWRVESGEWRVESGEWEFGKR